LRKITADNRRLPADLLFHQNAVKTIDINYAVINYIRFGKELFNVICNNNLAKISAVELHTFPERFSHITRVSVKSIFN
jgi:ABC-type glucose/galactose transport system permease subunit